MYLFIHMKISQWAISPAKLYSFLQSQREFQDKLLTAGARPDQLSLLGTSNGAVGDWLIFSLDFSSRYFPNDY